MATPFACDRMSRLGAKSMPRLPPAGALDSNLGSCLKLEHFDFRMAQIFIIEPVECRQPYGEQGLSPTAPPADLPRRAHEWLSHLKFRDSKM
ncbi:hypothetical protein [Zavarzinia sp.]|uniref:hypothetical protein n=1 Tax=Zavarzinia sp. TaxID=2027920 RepID=UPI003565ECF5